MWRTLAIVGTVAFTAACAPIRTAIENDTGVAIEVEVVSPSGKLIAKSEIPARTGLDLKEQLSTISVVRYAYDRKTCVLSGADASAAAIVEYGARSVHLRGR
jgi:hypothetical protein